MVNVANLSQVESREKIVVHCMPVLIKFKGSTGVIIIWIGSWGGIGPGSGLPQTGTIRLGHDGYLGCLGRGIVGY